MRQPIVNLADVEFQPRPNPVTGAAAERYEATFARVGALVGARQLGYNVTAVPPGKRAYPFHSHRVNEEMFFVLAGSGEVRIGAATHPLRQGDFVACPAGGPEAAHQIINTGPQELRYLSVSTQRAPEICEYPDSGKFGVVSAHGPASSSADAFRFVGRPGDAADYWDGE